jgi:hypothetical protein
VLPCVCACGGGRPLLLLLLLLPLLLRQLAPQPLNLGARRGKLLLGAGARGAQSIPLRDRLAPRRPLRIHLRGQLLVLVLVLVLLRGALGGQVGALLLRGCASGVPLRLGATPRALLCLQLLPQPALLLRRLLLRRLLRGARRPQLALGALRRLPRRLQLALYLLARARGGVALPLGARKGGGVGACRRRAGGGSAGLCGAVRVRCAALAWQRAGAAAGGRAGAHLWAWTAWRGRRRAPRTAPARPRSRPGGCAARLPP